MILCNHYEIELQGILMFNVVVRMCLIILLINPIHTSGIVGKIAPMLRVEHWVDNQGNPITKKPDMKDYAGKLLYIYCWQFWCPGCHSQGFPTLQRLINEFGDSEHIKFLAIQTTFEGGHINTLDKVEKIAEKYNLDIPMGHTQAQLGQKIPLFMQDYRTGGTPWGILIGPDRRVLLNGYELEHQVIVKLMRQFQSQE
tara:strand:- start:3092 stop:3685 length:594 start_codon:yes stop_codon:yes gene_type:complete